MSISLSDFPVNRFEGARTPTWFWNGEESIELNKKLVKSLEYFSDHNNTNCRICFHTSPSECCHIMVIVERTLNVWLLQRLVPKSVLSQMIVRKILIVKIKQKLIR